MKQRFSTIDVAVIAHELSKSLENLRLTNIYDLSSKIFLLKFAKPGHREQLLVDSGFRCHLTRFNRTAAAAPSPFVARLRKCLRTRRVTSVSQIGTDRIVDIAFSGGQYRLFLEFYAGGNVVLTDRELNVVALLRVVAKNEREEELRVGLKYDIDGRQNYGRVPEVEAGKLREVLKREKEEGKGAGGKKKGKKASGALRSALSVGFPEFPPILLDHAFLMTGFDATVPLEQILVDEVLLEKVLLVLREGQKVFDAVVSDDRPKGYIIAKHNANGMTDTSEPPAKEPEDHGGLLYEDFHPFRPKQFEDNPSLTILEHDGFNKTVDEFFSSLESQKLESRLTEREANARRKLDAAKQDHEKRLGALQDVQELNTRKAGAIEANIERTEEAIGAVNGLIGQGMDWVEIARLIEMEQSRGNAVAQIIKLPLKLYENTVTLLLGEASAEPEDEDDEGYETESEIDTEDERQQEASKPRQTSDNRLAIDVDLGLSPWSNARQYYDQKRSAALKEQKTLQSSSKALQSTERKINADLKKELKQEKQVLRPARKQLWFEKFTFFISSDGHLVIGGKDAQQNETLYRRYLKKGDVYVHADLQGAASVIVKNKPNTPDAPIPPATLSQAGTLSVCTSNAWDSKAVMAAWWVNFDQVSKTAPTGEYLTTGGFMIKGKKNFLPPAQLILGFAVMWQVSEESKAKHVKHRLQDVDGSLKSSQDKIEDVNVEADEAEESADDDIDGRVDDDQDQNPKDKAASENEETDADEEGPDEPALENKEEWMDDDEDVSEEESNPLQSRSQAPRHEHTKIAENPNSEDQTDPPENQIPETLAENDAKAHSGDEEDSDHGIKNTNFQMSGALPPSATSTASRPTKHLSAKQRRLLRKGKPLDPGQSTPSRQPSADSSDVDQDPPQHATGTSTPLSHSSTTPKPSAQQPRGKRAKNRKAASKYKDQDAEDRELAMRLLGSAAEKKVTEDAASKAVKAADLELQRQRRREQHQRNLQATKQHEETRQLLADEGIEELSTEEAAEISNLDAFVGTALPGDEIVAAIPVCAPWSALARYKYKVKLQPGSTKKGKAVREILGKWSKARENKKAVDEKGVDTEKVWPREIELVKGWKEAEVVGVVPVGKVRVVVSGGGSGGGGGGGGGGGNGGGSGQGKGKGSARGGKGGKRR